MRKITTFITLLFFTATFSQITTPTAEGPFNQLIIRGATLINGNGAPPIGPVDISVENDKITAIDVVGYPGVAIDETKRPQLKKGGKELDAT